MSGKGADSRITGTRGKAARVTLAATTLGAAVVFVLFSLVHRARDGEVFYWFEAESAVRVETPMEISGDATASGGRCVELKEGMGAAIFGRWGGEAVFEIPFPEPGRYVLWARTYWTNGCGNSFFIRFGGELFHFGEDSIFEEWHWVNILLPEVTEGGTETLTIANREDGVKIDNILITKNMSFVPQGVGGEIRIYRFNDGTAGEWMHGDETLWEIRDGYGMDKTPAYHLAAVPAGVRPYAITDFRSGDEFVFRCLARCAHRDPEKRDIRFIFGYRSDDDYWFADFGDGSAGLGRIENGIERRVQDAGNVAGSYLRLHTGYHLFEIAHKADRLELKFDGFPVMELDGRGISGGAFGIGSRHGDVYFDDIIIGKEQTFSYSENFYYDDERPVEVVRNWRPQAGTWVRSSVHGPHTYEVQTRDVAASLAGNPLWHNYQFSAVASGDGESGIGILFYCIDNRNTYLFRWGGNSSRKSYAGRKQLLRVLDGRVTVLAEADGGYDAEQWYRMKARLHDGRITTFIDDRTVFDCFDRSLLQGMVGLYTDGPGPQEAGFPDRHFWPSVYTGPSWRETFPITIAAERFIQTVYACYQDSLNYYAVRWGGNPDRDARENVRFVSVRDGQETILQERPNSLEYANTYIVIPSYRDGLLEVIFRQTQMIDIADMQTTDVMRFAVENPVFTGGRIAVGSGVRANGMFDDIKVASLSDAYDDFSVSLGGRPLHWIQKEGSWIVENQSLTAGTDSPCRIFTGDGRWRDYTVEVDCILDGRGTGEAGVFFHHEGDGTYRFYHMESRGDSVVHRLLRVSNGVTAELDRRVDLSAPVLRRAVRIEQNRGWIGVFLDGVLTLEAYDAVDGKGMVGLFAAGAAGISFDDFSVRPDTRRRAFERVNSVFSSQDVYAPGMKTIEGWIDERGAFDVRDGALYVNGSGRRTVVWRMERDFLDDLSVSFDVRGGTGDEADCGVALTSGDSAPDTGYLFLVGRGRARLMRNGTAVAERNVAPADRAGWRTITFERRRGYCVGLVDGECRIVYRDKSSIAGGRVGLVVDGGSALIDNVNICTYPHRLYSFNLARWCAEDISAWRVDSGGWGVIASLSYSLFGEKNSDRDAVLWHKEPLENDFALYLEYMPVDTRTGGEFFVALRADGRSTGSGYLLRIAYEIENGNADSRVQHIETKLFRRGITVAGSDVTVAQRRPFMHVRVEKRSNTLTLFIGDERVLTFDDGAVPSGEMFALGVTGPPSSATIFNIVAIFDLLR